MRIGAILDFNSTSNGTLFNLLKDVHLDTCQISCWDPYKLTPEVAQDIRRQCDESHFSPCALWSGYTGPQQWNFTAGPVTLGLVPPEYRSMRIAELKHLADIALILKVPAIITHCGFIPENVTDANYLPTVLAIAEVARYCQELGLEFWFETGQETPVVLLRTINRLAEFGLTNLGLNLDGANLIMYGKGSPLDAVEVFGKYVRNLHVKDGMPPTDGDKLGKEVQVGQGRVNYPALLKRLRQLGFDGELIIEREISAGPEKNRDVLETMANLQKWWDEADPAR